MVKNEGGIDRGIRVVLAIVFIILAVTINATWATWLFGILAVVMLLTAALGICPLYMPFHLSTNKNA
ncbi:MAG: DUF2892 domain-containing protein [Corynebacterium sp.]|nr:DUF2892 domain-containing protein [Corynebacterium sp.]